MWQKLIHLALLESDKRPAPEVVLEPAVKEALSAADASEKESYFLKAAAFSLVRHYAGKRPEAALPVPATAPSETQPYCPNAVQFILSKLLSDPARNNLLIQDVLEKIRGRNQIIPPVLLVSVLQWMAHHKKQAKISELVPVLGVRGQWLAEQNPDWKYLTEAKSIDQLVYASQTARRKLLAELRPKWPGPVLEHIRQSWPLEGVPERREFLQILAVQPEFDEIQFIQEVFEELCQPQSLKKAANKDLRRMAAAILLAHPRSNLFQHTVARLGHYTAPAKGLFNLPGKSKWTLPAEHDAFFCPQIMVEQLGFDMPEQPSKLSDAAFWFGELTRCLHPTAWETHFAAGWPAILAFWETANYSTNTWPLLQNGSQALARTQYRPGILAYLEQYTLNSTNTTMLQALTAAELTKWLFKTPELPPSGLLASMLDRPGWVWSPELSRLLLKHLMQEDNIYQNAATACDLCLHFDLAILDDLFQLIQRDAFNWQQHQIIKKLAVPLFELMKLRKEIEGAFF